MLSFLPSFDYFVSTFYYTRNPLAEKEKRKEPAPFNKGECKRYNREQCTLISLCHAMPKLISQPKIKLIFKKSMKVAS